ncbi:hypothetical protein SPRG_03779 [Saprolegnia parasitica CBS 223.65]|uniref:Uncharacterized protein n=1 Tax=Saprolegnia parasitica (strain CBS 223.65) TaxID=695850 RepID=A0A067CMD5_SAPPC|nr:hypothetical protein SPRG_03779 [Saprolegnia parasitica CBS 223.65]KDO31859.1 hypothetical protein SPRG_03779 [Saprolegnia parasitica CBS 223.65]|eukprot:XP_012197737.1 hypothetical protein SPRG_03779 [Saprolegnia parasitica CBS 223.65]
MEVPLPLRSVWLQAHAPRSRDEATCVLRQLQRLHGEHDWRTVQQLLHWVQSGATSRPCACCHADCAASWTSTRHLEKTIEYEQFLLSLALRHVAVTLKEDRAWTLSALDALYPVTTCLEVALLEHEAIKPLGRIWQHLRLACGGNAYMERHAALVASYDAARWCATATAIDQLFVPKFSNVVDPFPEFTASATPIVLSGFQTTFHPRMPRMLETHKASDTVLGYAWSTDDESLFALKAMELQIALGRLVYAKQTRTRDPLQDVPIAPHLPMDCSSVPYLVEFRRGNIPILLSIPHGGGTSAATASGRWQLSHLTQRTPSKTSAKRFTVFADTRTVHVGADASKALDRRTNGAQPYMVIAKFHRKFVDVNRAHNEDAYVDDTPWTQHMYATYHSTLLHALQEIWLRFPMFDPLLLDVHGQRAATCPRLGISNLESKQLLYIGTQNGLTIRSMDVMQRYFLGHLHGALQEQAWLGIYPLAARDKDGGYAWDLERKEFLGGYIVRTYGHSATGANAIQLEFGASMRGADVDVHPDEAKAQRQRTSEALAVAMASYIEHIGLGFGLLERDVYA